MVHDLDNCLFSGKIMGEIAAVNRRSLDATPLPNAIRSQSLHSREPHRNSNVLDARRTKTNSREADKWTIYAAAGQKTASAALRTRARQPELMSVQCLFCFRLRSSAIDFQIAAEKRRSLIYSKRITPPRLCILLNCNFHFKFSICTTN